MRFSMLVALVTATALAPALAALSAVSFGRREPAKWEPYRQALKVTSISSRHWPESQWPPRNHELVNPSHRFESSHAVRPSHHRHAIRPSHNHHHDNIHNARTLILRDAEESGAFSFSDLGKDIKKGFQTVGNVAKKVAVAAAPYVGDAVSIGAGLLLRREEELELMARRAAILDVLAREELSLE